MRRGPVPTSVSLGTSTSRSRRRPLGVSASRLRRLRGHQYKRARVAADAIRAGTDSVSLLSIPTSRPRRRDHQSRARRPRRRVPSPASSPLPPGPVRRPDALRRPLQPSDDPGLGRRGSATRATLRWTNPARGASTNPRTIKVPAAAAPRLALGHCSSRPRRPTLGRSKSRPRRCGDPPSDAPGPGRGGTATRPQTIQVTAAAALRPALLAAPHERQHTRVERRHAGVGVAAERRQRIGWAAATCALGRSSEYPCRPPRRRRDPPRRPYVSKAPPRPRPGSSEGWSRPRRCRDPERPRAGRGTAVAGTWIVRGFSDEPAWRVTW